jgi:putative ABC transport system ATP-binding protein
VSLILKDLRKSFLQGDTEIKVLSGVNAEIKEGQIVAIVGQSGSGKSTLLSLLAGLEKADSGEIRVDGTDIAAMSESQITNFRARNISIVFQQYHLVSHLTALENVQLPLEILGRPDAEQKSRKLLEDMGLSHRISHFSNQMSGGESQRVAIARALVVEPKILLADEPSGNLDIHTGEKVMEIFFAMAKKQKMTTILVTHSEALAKRCERILHLEEGRLREG